MYYLERLIWRACCLLPQDTQIKEATIHADHLFVLCINCNWEQHLVMEMPAALPLLRRT